MTVSLMLFETDQTLTWHKIYTRVNITFSNINYVQRTLKLQMKRMIIFMLYFMTMKGQIKIITS